jgi:hypothetical protein
LLTQQLVHKLLDYDLVMGILTWRVRAAPNVYAGDRAGSNAYKDKAHTIPQCRFIRINKRGYIEARVIWLWMTGAIPPDEIDHKDTNPFNNKWGNLRLATSGENTAHRRNYRPGKLKWVRKDKYGFVARVTFQSKVHYLGSYRTEQEAHDAAYAVAQQLHGSFVQRN